MIKKLLGRRRWVREYERGLVLVNNGVAITNSRPLPDDFELPSAALVPSTPVARVDAERADDLADYFGCLIATGHTLEEAIDGVRHYAAGSFGSME